LNVFIPQAPNAPSLLSGDLEGFVDDEFNLAWDSEGLNTRIEIKDSSGHKVNSFSDKNVIWRPKLIGKYTARAWTVDKYGRTSPPSKPIGILVKAQPPKQEAQKKPEEPVRKPTSIVAALTSKIEAVALRIFNEKYKSSQLSINGFLWGMFSSEQTAAGEANPIASGIGFKGYIWKGNHGVEVLAKSGVLGVNDIGEEQSSLKDIEARYHYRFFTGFPFGISRELQVTFFGGYEAYRNAGGSFSSEYDLVKLGTSLQFPFSSHWMSGGEFVYGLGPGGNWKGEVSGNLSYFMNFNWSFGVGYRIHLFNAGTAEASPKGRIPYREGYTVGYSVINYHF